MAKAYHNTGPERKGVERKHVADVKESAAAVSSIPKAEFALRAARRGMRVFPMLPNSAVTASADAYCDPSADEDQIRDWWSADPDQNIGLATSDLLVLHTTSTKAVDALGDLISAMLGDTPKTTRTVICDGRKISDGYLIFSLPKGTRVEEREILPGVRVLGDDDAILGPGSEIDELESIFANERSVATAPSWLIEMCGVQLPESILVSNIVPIKKAALAPAATELAAATKSPTKTKLDWALEAAQYIPVHPLRWYVDPGPNASPKEREDAVKAAKAALVFDWPNLATQDPEQIRKWWTQWPRANVGGATNDFIVVDIDPRNGGDDTFAGLLAVEYDFPETATTRSQSGGRHLIYVAPDGPVKGDTKGDVLGVGIDVKARGGYVVMPGSTIEGRMYTRENARPPAFAPQWIVERLKTARPKTAAAGKRVAPDDDAARAAAEHWLATKAPRAELGSRDNTGYVVGTRFGDFGCGYENRLDLLLHWNETKCSPPLDIEDLERLADSSGRNRERPLGCLHPTEPLGFEAEDIDESKAPPAAEIDESKASMKVAPIAKKRLYAVRADEGIKRALENPGDPLIKGVIDRGTMSVLIGAPNAGKTFFALDMSYHVATGKPWAGKPVKQGAVVYLAAEAGNKIMSRLAALEVHHGSIGAAPLYVIPCSADFSHTMEDAKRVVEIIREVEQESGQKVELFVADTVARLMAGGDENSSKDMGAIIMAADFVREQTQVHTMLIHHPGKDESKRGRGHSSLLGGTDTEMIISNHTLTFTKQRDLPMGPEIKFTLPVVQIGVDKEGEPVTSCRVQIHGPGEHVEQQPLPRRLMDLVDLIDAALADEPKRRFGWQFVAEIPELAKSGTPPKRAAVQGWMSDLLDAGWIRKPAPNQYVREMPEMPEYARSASV